MTNSGFGRMAQGSEGVSPFDTTRLLDLAQSEFGGDIALDDLGAQGFTLLCADLDDQAERLSFMGKKLLQRALVETLLKRACTDRAPAAQSPAPSRPAPIFIVAPFRSGTTLLHRLWSQDPKVQAPATWQVSLANPEPSQTDAAIAAVATYLERTAQISPALARLHPTGATLPEECFGLLEPSFCAPSFLFWADLPEYRRWLGRRSRRDWEKAYRRYAGGLDRIAARQTPQWILKSPFHLWGLQGVLDVFPEARIIQIHRDPAKVMASTAALLQANRMLFARSTPPADPSAAADLMQTALSAANTARAGADPARFIDVDYDGLTRDPVGTIDRLYGQLGQTLGAEARQRMDTWLKDNPAPASVPQSGTAAETVVPPALRAFNEAASGL
ncbi:sulfotransferase family protein [Flavimaricola marinus]|uniref:Sulfotransferase domain protein n=1 Tax=Flavimaricola marinus TaxID=1819565 RepID=A0A238LIB9_9RHOB|nr:sulfotransferase [Flavimaricola marinus]SMY09154.1 Sulfotransferase domain protein [Flavimaricola marinus]